MKRKRVINMQPSLMVSFLVIFLALFTVIGCSEDVSKDVSNPAPSTFEPKGTIQGYLVDSTTNEPIVGAKVSVGLGEDTTDAKGQFVISDVPATHDALNSSVSGIYNVTIDLRSVTSPVDMTKTTTTQRYPEFAYDSVAVKYTSLNDTECQDSFDSNSDDADDAETCNTSSNHDTPVHGLVASFTESVGRLACNIKGTVYGCDDAAKIDYYDEFATPQTSQVRLVAGLSTDNSTTGFSGNIVIPATDTTNGVFEINNIECGGASFTIVAADDLDDPTMHDSLSVSSPDGIGETLVLHLEENNSESDPAKDQVLHLCPNDDIGPKIVSVSPESGSDLSSSTSQIVTVTFHEPVAQDSYASTDPSGVGNLYDNIEVRFDGTKASNVSYSATWLPSGCTDDCTQLQVTIPTAKSSKYHVNFMNIDNLRDAAGNTAAIGLCPDDSEISENWNLDGTNATNLASANSGDNDCTIAFSTTGSDTPSQVTDLVLVNNASLNEGVTDVGYYNWSMVPGAKTYAMYCQKIQVWGSTTQEGPYVKDDTSAPLATDGILITGSSALVDFDILADGINNSIAFVENSDIKLYYNCKVAGVNEDNEEGPLSEVLANPADDVVGPDLEEEAASGLSCASTGVIPDGAGAGDSGPICTDGSTIDKIVLEFNGELKESSAETESNYAISGLSSGSASVSSAIYDAATDSVLLTLATAINPLDLKVTRITTGANGIANTTAAGTDTQTVAVNNGAAGGAGGPCVIDNGTDTVQSNDDVDNGREITAGPNGFCETTANSSEGDVQLQPVSTIRPSGACVEDTDGNGSTTVAPDDTLVNNPTGADYIHVGANGVCNTTAGTGDVQLIAVGSGVAYATAISAGGDGLLDTETISGDDEREGGKITVSGVTDVAGNIIRTTADEYYSDGSVR